jgi:integrase
LKKESPSGHNKVESIDFTRIVYKSGKKSGKMDYVLAKLYKPKKGEWYVYFKVRNQETGKMHMFKHRKGLGLIKDVKERKAVADSRIIAYNARLKNGWSPFRPDTEDKLKGLTLEKVFNELLLIKKASLRHRSYQHYKYAIDLFFKYCSKTMKPFEFTKALAQGYSDHLIKQFSQKSHNNQILNMGTLFNMMVEREIILKNPFAKIKKKPVDIGKNIAYSDQQREQIKNYLERNHLPIYMLVQFIYYCFIRPNELMQLQVRHIDFSGKQIQIPANISKNRNQSSVEIPETFFDQVKERFSNMPADYYLFGKGLIPGEIKVHRNRASAAHKKVLDDLKITGDHTLYSWKHTGAVAAIKSGMNPYTLMRQLRHSSLDQTMIYLKSLGLTSNSEFSLKQPKF